MRRKIEFDDLPEEVRLNYIQDAFYSLVSDNRVPYGIATGDTGVWDEYDPAIQLAEQNYDDDEDHHLYYDDED